MEADKEEANGGPESDGNARPEEVEPHEHHYAAKHHRKNVRIQRKPQRKLVVDRTMALALGDMIYRVHLDPWQCGCVSASSICHTSHLRHIARSLAGIPA